MRVNCAAIPENLFESELFGYVRGALTGALNDRPGRFEAAHGLQGKELERVGETRPRKIDVRIVAATNRDLAAEVEAGRFRADLFYRLDVFPIESPPLRDRREHIPLLAEHFIQASARQLRRRQLMTRDWPGNIRELENVIQRAITLAREGELRFDPRPAPPASPPAAASGALPLLSRAAMEKHQRHAIAAALGRSGGRVSGPGGAAELLGMKPSTLYSRMSALGLRQKTARHLPCPCGEA